MGDLTHAALEHGITDVRTLQRTTRHSRQSWFRKPALAEAFRKKPVFEPARDLLARSHSLEATTRIELAGITFSGRIDALTDSAVLDYKTDRVPDPERHAMQLALYARANNVQKAVLAYLRAEELHVFAEQQLEEAFGQASKAAAGSQRGVRCDTGADSAGSVSTAASAGSLRSDNMLNARC